jgi:hypothetical protein
MREARTVAGEVRAEGLELHANLREMGDSLRSNAERLLRDVQAVHSRMVAELDRIDGGQRPSPAGRPGPARVGGRSPSDVVAPRRDRGRVADGGEVLDVPEFIPQR